MPNTKSAIRRVRRVKTQTAVNKVRKSKYKSAVKHMEKLIKKGDKKAVKEYFAKLMWILFVQGINQEHRLLFFQL